MDIWIAVFAHLGSILVLVILGIVFSKGKGAFLIAGYNTATPEERARYDEKALCRCTGKLMFALAGCFGVATLGIYLDVPAVMGAGYLLFAVVTVAGIVYANKSDRVKRK